MKLGHTFESTCYCLSGKHLFPFLNNCFLLIIIKMALWSRIDFFFFFLIILSIIIRKAGCEFIDPSKQGFLNKILMFDNVRFWKVGRTKTFSYFFFFIDDVINFYARRIYIESSRKGLLNNILMFSDVFRFCRKIF